MVLKRPFHEQSGNGGAGEEKRFKNAVRDVLGKLSVNDFASKMEPFLRAVVRDEVERSVSRILQPSSRPSFNQAGASGRRGLLLQFVNKSAPTLFTGAKIEAEDGSPIKVMLLDANTKSCITSGSQSSMKIEILALNADFGSDDSDDWTEHEFSANIIREREGRRPLVAGELNVTLRNGVGEIGDVFFTDNSSWQRSRKFRLGARTVQRNSGVREARSEAFVVKDHRGEHYKKHYPPALNDEVWRLEKIAKEGALHKRLTSHGIQTVKQFLRLYARDSSKLCKVLGDGSGISTRIWKAIIGHATTCVPNDGKFYTFHEDCVGLLFNSIYKIVGASFDGRNFEPLGSLTAPQKALVEKMKRQAYKNDNDLVLIDTNSVPRTLVSPQAEPINSLNLGLQQLGFPVACQDQPEIQLDFNNVSGSALSVYDVASSSTQSQVPLAQNNHPMQAFPPEHINSFKLVNNNYTLPNIGESSWFANTMQWPSATSGELTAYDIPEIQTSTWPTGISTWGQGSSAFFLASSDEGEVGIFSSHPSFGVHMSGIRKSNAGWCKLRAALKWKSVGRKVGAKSLCDGFYGDYQC